MNPRVSDYFDGPAAAADPTNNYAPVTHVGADLRRFISSLYRPRQNETPVANETLRRSLPRAVSPPFARRDKSRVRLFRRDTRRERRRSRFHTRDPA